MSHRNWFAEKAKNFEAPKAFRNVLQRAKAADGAMLSLSQVVNCQLTRITWIFRLAKREIDLREKVFRFYRNWKKIIIIWCLLISICRFGEPDPARGRQTLCKHYLDNELLNEQLQRIKSARTVDEFEKLLQEQLRCNQGFAKSAKSIEPYFDFEAILRSKTCLISEKLQYRFDGNQLLNENRNTSAPEHKCHRLSRIENFAFAAAECYEKCIGVYLNDLSALDRRVERERQSILSHIDFSLPSRLRQVFDDSSLANRIDRIKISFQSSSSTTVSTSRPSVVHHIPRVSQQTMSSNDSNNNREESTNQVKDPPKIVLSDHSSNQNNIVQVGIAKNYRESEQVTDKNCYLSVPIRHCYSSEARPPWKQTKRRRLTQKSARKH